MTITIDTELLIAIIIVAVGMTAVAITAWLGWLVGGLAVVGWLFGWCLGLWNAARQQKRTGES